MCAEIHDTAALLDTICGIDENNFNDPTFMVARGIMFGDLDAEECGCR